MPSLLYTEFPQVESAVNDYYSRSAGSQKWSEAQAALEGTNVHKYTEFLVRRLRTLFPTSALVWLAAGFTGFSKRRRAHAPIMLKSAEDIHYSVLHLYDVPQVSLMDSLLPGSSESMRQWIKSKLFVDDKYECKSKQENQATSVQHAC
eukprot:m.786120 g.786120  ORF g.786120 m.786120 type:complete len:148 (+) comp23304_c0_seq42:190-633(+)